MDLLLDARIEQHLGALAIGAGKLWRGSEEAADQWALGVDLAAVFSQVRAAEIGQRRRVFRSAFDR